MMKDLKFVPRPPMACPYCGFHTPDPGPAVSSTICMWCGQEIKFMSDEEFLGVLRRDREEQIFYQTFMLRLWLINDIRRIYELRRKSDDQKKT